MNGALADLRVGLRQLLRSPRFLLATVPVLALGVGATTAVFSMAHGSLLRPLPYGEAQRVVKVQDQFGGSGRGGSSVANYLDLRERARTLEVLAAYQDRSLNLAGLDAPVRAQGLAVTADFLQALGVAPRVGRGFQPGEERAGSSPVVVLTHVAWEARFDADPSLLGQAISVHGVPTTVVGILPEGFWFPGEPELLVPFAWTDAELLNRGNRQLELVGRLAPGVEIEAARSELRAHFADLAAAYPAPNEGWNLQVDGFSDWAFQAGRNSVRLLLGAAFLTLLVACVNVASLVLVRGKRRWRELAVRSALGAGRGRLVRHFALEGLLISVFSAALGILIAAGGLRVLLGLYGGSLPRAQEVGLNATVLGFSVGLALLSGLAAGVIPALRLPTHRLEASLRSGGSGATRSGGRVLQVLVVAEVAVAMVVVVGAGLLTHSFWRLNQVEMGFERGGAVTFQAELPAAAYPSPEEQSAFFRRALEEVGALPGVQAVGITDRVPGRGGFNITALASPDDPEVVASFVEVRSVSPGLFHAAGIPLLSGRLLTERDAEEGNQAVVISDVLASTIFPEGDPLGRRILPEWNDGGGFEVVGVVGSVREFGPVRDIRPAVYWAYPGPTSGPGGVFVLRTAGEAVEWIPSVRNAFASLDASIPIHAVRTLEESTLAGVQNRRVAATLFSLFGGVALLLAAMGVFSVLAFVVEQRTREIGIRVALGATRRRVAGLVMGRGLGLVLGGVVVGVVASLAASRLLQELLFEVSVADPATLGIVSALALLLGCGASWVPVRRALATDPILVLKEE